MNSELTITQYTEKSFVVRGNTKDNKEQLKAMNGKYNSMLKGGPGWIFPNGLRSNIEKYISTGVVTKSVNRTEYVNEIKDTKDVKDEENKESYANKIISSMTPNKSSLTQETYIKTLENRIEELEKKMAFVLKSVLTNIQSSPTSNKTEDEDEEDNMPRKRLLK